MMDKQKQPLVWSKLMTKFYLMSCECGNCWTSKKPKAQCSQAGCYKINEGESLK